MEKKDNERINFDFVETETPREENSVGETERFGRFKNADVLYNSYLKLEAEFTRRSQQLKRLRNLCAEHGFDEEGQPLVKAEGANAETAGGEKPEQESAEEAKPTIKEAKGVDKDDGKGDSSDGPEPSPALREKIIKEYLDGVARSRIPLLKGGSIVPAGRQRISSIDEAGNLSLQYFRGGNK